MHMRGEVGRVFEYFTFSKVFRFTPREVDEMDEELKELYLFILEQIKGDK